VIDLELELIARIIMIGIGYFGIGGGIILGLIYLTEVHERPITAVTLAIPSFSMFGYSGLSMMNCVIPIVPSCGEFENFLFHFFFYSGFIVIGLLIGLAILESLPYKITKKDEEKG
jgi:hypothetical protein